MIRTNNLDRIEDGSTNKHKIKLMPVLAAWMSPRNFVLRFGFKEGISNAKIEACAKFKKSLTIFIYFTNIEFA